MAGGPASAPPVGEGGVTAPDLVVMASWPADPTGPVTGPQRVVTQMVEALAGAGAAVEVWTAPYPGRPRPSTDAPAGVRVVVTGPAGIVRLAASRPAAPLLIGSYSLFHALPAATRRMLGRSRRIVYVAHGVVAEEGRLGAPTVPGVVPAVERGFLHADRIIVLAEGIAGTLHARYGVPEDRFVVIPPATPDGFTPPDAEVPTGPPVFLFAGDARPTKGLDVLGAAVMRLHDDAPDRPWRLELAGGAGLPPPDPVWEAVAGTGRLKVRGPLGRAALLDAYRAATVLVLASRYEPYGMVVAEALAAGTPAIVSDRVGARCLVDATGAGTVVPAGSVAGLAGALRRVLDRPEEVAGWRRAARRMPRRDLTALAADLAAVTGLELRG